MKFPYTVKYNGVIYPANTPIEEVEAEPLEVLKETPISEEKKPSRKKGE